MLLSNVSLKKYNTLALDTKARYFLEIKDVNQLLEFIAEKKFQKYPKLVVGEGSNLLLRKDYPGIVLLCRLMGVVEEISNDDSAALLGVQAGENWHGLVRKSLSLGLCGLENLSMIPGTVGAAPVQNIGAYGVELMDVFESLSAIDISTGQRVEFSKSDCEFAYRESIFKTSQRDRYFITSIKLKLSRHPKLNLSYQGLQQALEDQGLTHPSASDVSDTVSRIRMNKLPNPTELSNVGSFFKNPIVTQQHREKLLQLFPNIPAYNVGDLNWKIPAAWLIEAAGWKGYRTGDAGVYEKHALVLVNYGGANGMDIWQLAQKIQASVLVKFDIRLEPEPRVVPE